MDSAEAGTNTVQLLRPIQDTADWTRLLRAESRLAFYESWISIQAQQIDGVVSGMLLVRDSGEAAFEAAARLPRGSTPGPALSTAAERTLQEGRGLIVQLEGPDSVGVSQRPIVTQVVEIDEDVLAVVMLELAPRPVEGLERALGQLAWGSAWLRFDLQRHQPSQGGSLESLFEIIQAPLEFEAFRAAATAFVTELATRFGCDRVAIGFEENGRVELAAVSRTALFSERANLTRATEAAMDEAIDQEKVVVWPPPGGHPLVTRAHETLAGESEARALCSVPVTHGDFFVGVVTLARDIDQPFDEHEIDLIDTAVALCGPLLELQRMDERWLFTKALDSARDGMQRLIGPRNVGLKLAATAIVVVVAFFAIAKGEYRVAADAYLEANELRAAVAPFDGYIVSAPVRAGDQVLKGQLLVALDERDLTLERARWTSQLQQLEKEQRQVMAERDAAKTHILSAQIDQSRARLALAEDQLAKAQLVASFDGVVVTGDLSQQIGAPVERGDLLFEIAPLGDYRLVLEIDEREVDEVSLGQSGSFVFSARPNEVHRFEVEKVTPVSNAEDGKNTFRVEARLGEPVPGMLPGMEGVAKIGVDQRHLIWIWTHDVVDWFRLALWKWMP